MTDVAVGARCALLPWDSAFFGLRIARFDAARPSAEEADRAVAWADEQAVDCMYALVDADAPEVVRVLEDRRFELADVRLTLDRATEESAGDSSVRHDAASIDEARHPDADALAALARVSHPGTRFTSDGRFGAVRAAELYATWVTGALSERDACVLVARHADRLAGYLALHSLGAAEARIGLVAVAADLQAQGIGRALAATAIRRARLAGSAGVSVVTQGRNAAAVRFYERCGFEPRSRQLWYHRWWSR